MGAPIQDKFLKTIHNRGYRWEVRNIAAGLCRHCARPRGENGTATMCRDCADAHRDLMRRRLGLPKPKRVSKYNETKE